MMYQIPWMMRLRLTGINQVKVKHSRDYSVTTAQITYQACQSSKLAQ
jgi:hypothetical protein